MSVEVQGLITDQEKSVQGSALYIELETPTGAITQMFITPDGVDESGVFVRSMVYQRRLTAEKPKRQWHTNSLSAKLVADEETGVTPEQHRYARINHLIDSLFRRATVASAKVVGKPFYVEVSKKDLADIRVGKTPTKIVYRIGQTRTVLGYPEMFTK